MPGTILDSYNIPVNKIKSLPSLDHKLTFCLLFAGHYAKPFMCIFYLVQKTILHRLFFFFGLYNVKTFWMSCQCLKLESLGKIQIASFSLKISNFGNTEPKSISTWKKQARDRDGYSFGIVLCFLVHCGLPACCTEGTVEDSQVGRWCDKNSI